MHQSHALLIAIFAAILSPLGQAATIEVISDANRPSIGGKEVDWIDGDYLIRNDQIVVVVARPGPIRDANMTTRGVGASVIDLTRRDIQSDQLTVVYPAGGRYRFEDDSVVDFQANGDKVAWTCRSSKTVADNGSNCLVKYQLANGEPFITMTVTINGSDAEKIRAYDGVRADRTFKFTSFSGTPIGYCEDEYFLQTYGFSPIGGKDRPKWTSNRPKQIHYPDAAMDSDDGNSVTWSVRLYPASSPIDLWGIVHGGKPQEIQVGGAVGDQPRISLTLLDELGPIKAGKKWRCQASGLSIVHLPPGEYSVRAEAVGHEPTEQVLKVNKDPQDHVIKLGPATTVTAKVTDDKGNAIPCKVSFYGAKDKAGGETKSPNFGLDSQYGSVGNTVYSVDGEFTRSLPPGTYDVVVSHGPEFDAMFTELTVEAAKDTKLRASLKRVIDTTGYVSAELHSHSSPSGDNTSDQLGRVENLVCEHLEFAPCTEHQRIESYDDQLKTLNAESMMKTCSGMELTGKLLPINHQNAFPLKYKPFAQDGGGPRIDDLPETQIARLAMWDDGAKKVVQTNHPNMRQMVFDRDLDGNQDGGFSKMLNYMDVIEVHPPEDIFKSDSDFKDQKSRDRSRMKPWMELIKSGRRIPGVVNTDAHYNWHGSGPLRNWVRSDTDDPAAISVDNMIDSLELGKVIMSTGPYMTVHLHHPKLQQPAEIGDKVRIEGPGELEVKIQCANWLDVNRVEVFVDGEPVDGLKRTRSTHSESFADDVVKFHQRLPINLKTGSFIIVAAIGENLQLGRVMGEQYGKRPPVVVSNPIYID